MQTIPCVPDVPRYTLDLTLSDVGYRMVFEFNERDLTWYFSLFLFDGTPIAQGVAVVLGYPLLYGVTHKNKPIGQLLAVDTSGADKPPGISELGDRVQLVYVLRNELLP